MAINQDYPVLDGIAPSWADIEIKCEIFDGPLIDIKDIVSINTGVTVEHGEQRGASGGRVMKRTTGAKSSEASWVLYADGHQKLIRNLATVAPRRGNQALIGLVHFNIQILHTPIGSDETYEMIVAGCKLKGRAKNLAEGTDADKVEMALNPIDVIDVVDGLEIVLL